MSMTLILGGAVFTAGFVWGFSKPTGYCGMSRDQQYGFGNRFLTGLINGVVFGGITSVLAYAIL